MITSRHEYLGYFFQIDYHAADAAYLVEFLDFPNVITSGASLPEAFANACESLDLHLESLQKLGRKLPRPKHTMVVETA